MHYLTPENPKMLDFLSSLDSPPLTISKKKILLDGMKTCDGVVVNMVLGAATRCPVLMIGKLSFCLDFPPPPQISSPRNQARLLPAQETCRLFVEIKLLILDSLL